MKKSNVDQKPRPVSDTSEKNPRLDPDQIPFRERSFTDVFAVFSKRPKMTKKDKKDASTNTTPLDEIYKHPAVAPPLPPKINHYYLSETLNQGEVVYELVYEGITNQERNMNVEAGLWMANQETRSLKKVKEDDTDEDSEDGLEQTTPTHKRNTSGWSLGSFHIGPPVELMNEVLSGEEWRVFLENNVNFAPDKIQAISDEPKAKTPTNKTNQGTAEDDVDGIKPKRSKSLGPDIDAILDSVMIVEQREESPKVPQEEPESPHILPPKLNPSSQAGIDKQFRSSVFYRYKPPPPGQELLPETPKHGNSTLEKIKAKLRKSSV